MYELGLAIDSSVNCSSDPWLACLAYWSSLSRSGPTVPLVPAGAKVGQPPQPWDVKSLLPDAASPLTAAVVLVVGTFPSTLLAVGEMVDAPPQPASRNASTRNGARRRIAASLLKRSGGLLRSREQPEAERREPAVARDVDRGVVDEERDDERNQVGVEECEPGSPQGQQHERG